MTDLIENMIKDLESGRLSRRQFAVSVATLAAGGLGAPGVVAAAPKKPELKAVSINHVTVRVPDLHRTSQFYQEFFGMSLAQQSAKIHILAVGDSFFGIEQGEGPTATVDHFDFGIASFNADRTRGLLTKRNLTFTDKTGQESFKFRDPDGFNVQVNGPDYKGHVGP